MDTTDRNSNDARPDYVQTITITDAHGNVKELVFPKALDLDRPKRLRTTFTKEQLDMLESVFKIKQYVVGKERTQLAQQLNLSENQIKVWFQNRRTKHKKEEEGGSDTPLVKSTELACQPQPGLTTPPIPIVPTIPLYFPGLPFALQQQVDNSAIAAVDNTEGADVAKQNIFRPFCL
ncbi:ventral anterior homeobox 1-like [Galendromus occidentalis]|uniref:Ventral anterior homeobox 1-like n=1 Tax=Galendromus occidentalis TaxID=34638 RepID=A0AAJ7SF01_9ACAR|nr:ventral anterior homeobox 1-like [Galendromus occidentalis]